MTYAQNTPIFKEAERTFSRGRVKGTVTADYEPLPMTYHTSFLKQYRWHLLGYTLWMSTLICGLLTLVLYDMNESLFDELPKILTLLPALTSSFVACQIFLWPVTLILLPAPIIWRQRYLALRDISEAHEAPADAHVLTSLE